MKNFLKENWFKIIIVLLAIYFLTIFSRYLTVKNDIEANSNRAKCMYEMIKWEKESGISDTRWQNVCFDILYQVDKYKYFK